jgi:DNA-binding transcriptional LysR family regulator
MLAMFTKRSTARKRYPVHHGIARGGKSLDIAVLPTFSSRWLIPRLNGFMSLPGDYLKYCGQHRPFILTGSGFDAVVHFEHSAWAGMRTQFLFQENWFRCVIPRCYRNDVNQQLNELPRIHRRQNPEAWHLYARERE